MTRPPLLTLLLALALAAPRAALAQLTSATPPPAVPPALSGSDFPSGGTGDLLTDILPANDPMAAFIFLGDAGTQAKLKSADPDRYVKVFARAAELKDMHDLIFSADMTPELRLAFLSRPDCQFCQRSTTMWAWVDKYLPQLYAERRKTLHEVYWDWDDLPKEQRNWLRTNGDDASSWKDLELSKRQEHLAGWAKDESAAILALNPKNPKEVEAMGLRIYAVYQVLGNFGTVPLMDRFSQVTTGLAGLDRARAMTAASPDPAVRKAYDDATKAKDPAERLAALSRLYDGTGTPDQAVMALAPARAGQTFDAQSRQMVAGLLGSAVMKETGGTWAGQELRAFFADHPMNVAVAPTDMPALAWYNDNRLTFNQKYVEQYVKSQGRTIDDLAKDPALLEPLVREIVPIFVHEATHQRQDAFAQSQNLPFYTGEAAEKEAMMTESLFVLQKAKQDPAYAAFLAANQDRSVNVKEALVLSQRLEKDRAGWYGETVMATHYPEFLSITGQAWCQILWHNLLVPPLQAELKRRATLPEDQRKALDGARDFKGAGYKDRQDFLSDIPSVGTAHLEDLLARQRKAFEKAPEAYAAYVQRLKDVTALTDQRLDQLEGPAPKKDAVPSPSDRR